MCSVNFHHGVSKCFSLPRCKIKSNWNKLNKLLFWSFFILQTIVTLFDVVEARIISEDESRKGFLGYFLLFAVTDQNHLEHHSVTTAGKTAPAFWITSFSLFPSSEANVYLLPNIKCCVYIPLYPPGILIFPLMMQINLLCRSWGGVVGATWWWRAGGSEYMITALFYSVFAVPPSGLWQWQAGRETSWGVHLQLPFVVVQGVHSNYVVISFHHKGLLPSHEIYAFQWRGTLVYSLLTDYYNTIAAWCYIIASFK